MSKSLFRKLTGFLFISGAILINIPYTLLILSFDYPDILRRPTGDILTQYQAGGTALVFTWLAFAWAGIPLFFAIVMLQKVLEREDTPYLQSATAAGIIGSIVQMIGLLRWVFVVPPLARTYTDPSSSEATKEAVSVIFQAVHHYGGVVLGEHVGQIFTIIWMMLTSVAMLRSNLFKPWVAWLGIVASTVYLLAQTELLAIAVPDFPMVAQAGLVGSLLWLGWMIVLGVFLIRAKTDSSTSSEAIA